MNVEITHAKSKRKVAQFFWSGLLLMFNTTRDSNFQKKTIYNCGYAHNNLKVILTALSLKMFLKKLQIAKLNKWDCCMRFSHWVFS